jgi:hypothetical protein
LRARFRNYRFCQLCTRAGAKKKNIHSDAPVLTDTIRPVSPKETQRGQAPRNPETPTCKARRHKYVLLAPLARATQTTSLTPISSSCSLYCPSALPSPAPTHTDTPFRWQLLCATPRPRPMAFCALCTVRRHGHGRSVCGTGIILIVHIVINCKVWCYCCIIIVFVLLIPGPLERRCRRHQCCKRAHMATHPQIAMACASVASRDAQAQRLMSPWNVAPRRMATALDTHNAQKSLASGRFDDTAGL